MNVSLIFQEVVSNAAGGGVQDSMSAISDTHDQIILALIAIIGTSVAALVYTIRNNTLNKAIAKDASEANKAVNNVGPGEHRMYDALVNGLKEIADKQAEFDRKWGNLPDDMDDAVGLVELLHSMSHRMDQVQTELREHVAWETSQKYPKG